MLRLISHVAAETCFALKGGTVISLFVRDMPRLSVDIDLVYLPVDGPPETALKNMSAASAASRLQSKRGLQTQMR